MINRHCGAAGQNSLESHLFGEPDFRFVVNFLKATEAGKGKPVDRKGTDLTDCRSCFQGRAAAFFMDQDKHVALQINCANVRERRDERDV